MNRRLNTVLAHIDLQRRLADWLHASIGHRKTGASRARPKLHSLSSLKHKGAIHQYITELKGELDEQASAAEIPQYPLCRLHQAWKTRGFWAANVKKE